MHPASPLDALLVNVLTLLPSGTKPTTTTLREEGGLQATFDPTCAGSIERAWPSIFDLCEKCGCNAQLLSVDRMEIISLLDTRSGAPNYSTTNSTEVVLVLTANAAEQQEVA